MIDDPSLIRVIHVTEYPSSYEYGVVWQTMREETIVERLQEAYKKRAGANERIKKLSFTVVFGSPGREICRFADDISAELIVMATHGNSGLTRLLLGSVAERVVRFAPCPVLMLRAASGEEEKSPVSTAQVSFA